MAQKEKNECRVSRWREFIQSGKVIEVELKFTQGSGAMRGVTTVPHRRGRGRLNDGMDSWWLVVGGWWWLVDRLWII